MHHPEATTYAPPEGFTVIDRTTTWTLGDVLAAQEQGTPVMRTPHVGNLAMYNCVLANAGIPLMLHDRTVPQQDKNYHPGLHIQDGVATPLIDPSNMHRLSTHIPVATPPALSSYPFRKGTLLNDAHLASAREAFPHTAVTTTSEYYTRNEATVMTVVRALAAAEFGDWQRRVSSDGTIHEALQDPQSAIQRYGIFRDGQNSTEWEGMLLPNSYNVLLTGIVDALNANTSHVIHVSGPDMIHYVKKMAPELSAMYQTVRTSTVLGKRLPLQLTYNIISATGARLAVPLGREEALNTMLDAYASYRATSRELTDARAVAAVALPADAKRAAFPRLKRTEAAHRDSLVDIRTICPEVFATTDTAAYLSHYDTLAAGGLYTHPANRTQTLGKLATYQLPIQKATVKRG